MITAQSIENLDDSDSSDDEAFLLQLKQEKETQKAQPWNIPQRKLAPQHRDRRMQEEKTEDTKDEALDAQMRSFKGLQVATNTSWLWGKRVGRVSCGNTVAYALTEEGELFCWGGANKTWKRKALGEELPETETTVETIQETKEEVAEVVPLTARTQVMKSSTKPQVNEGLLSRGKSFLRRMFGDKKPPQRREMGAYEKEFGLTTIAEYYDIPVIDLSATRRNNLQYLERHIYPKIEIGRLQLSLQLRGVNISNRTKHRLFEDFSECITLEVECMGKEFHNNFRRLEEKVRQSEVNGHFSQSKE